MMIYDSDDPQTMALWVVCFKFGHIYCKTQFIRIWFDWRFYQV